MAEPTPELESFVKDYEAATNSHDVDRVTAMIAADATYWFTDGSFHGIDAIRDALTSTFDLIQDETYEITDVEWISVSDESASYRYRFRWTGTIDGQLRSGRGRGTNVITKRQGSWKMLHEHLST